MVKLRCPVTINHIHQERSCTYMITYKQLSLADIFTDCQNKFDNDKYEFLSILEQTIDLDEIVPVSFVSHFHAATGRPRRHLLYPMLKALLLQLIFSIPTISLLIVFLKYSQELRDFCGFSKVPDAPLFTRFRQNFEPYIELTFRQMVDFTEPICQLIDSTLSQSLTFDTSGIELFVAENNPKTLNSLIKRLKAFYKDNTDVDPYKMTYSLMPSSAASSPDAKQMYINGHFCYADKFAILTNGLGIVREIVFLNDDFKTAHPELPV